MKIEESFYTISASELKCLCKKYAMKGFAKDESNYEFETMFGHDMIHMMEQRRISRLDFNATVTQDGN